MVFEIFITHSTDKRSGAGFFVFYQDTIELYKDHSGAARRGFNEFILAALKQMEEYEVADDIEAYKALLSVLPRGGRLRPASFLHADMGAYKQQQDTVTRLLMQLNAHREFLLSAALVVPASPIVPGEYVQKAPGLGGAAACRSPVRVAGWIPRARLGRLALEPGPTREVSFLPPSSWGIF